MIALNYQIFDGFHFPLKLKRSFSRNAIVFINILVLIFMNANDNLRTGSITWCSCIGRSSWLDWSLYECLANWIKYIIISFGFLEHRYGENVATKNPSEYVFWFTSDVIRTLYSAIVNYVYALFRDEQTLSHSSSARIQLSLSAVRERSFSAIQCPNRNPC